MRKPGFGAKKHRGQIRSVINLAAQHSPESGEFRALLTGRSADVVPFRLRSWGVSLERNSLTGMGKSQGKTGVLAQDSMRMETAAIRFLMSFVITV